MSWDANVIQVWVPRFLGAAPFAIAGLAVLRAHTENIGLTLVLLALSLVMLFGLWARRGVLKALKIGHGPRTSRHVQLWSLGAAVLAMLVFTLWPVPPSTGLGAIGVVYVGLGCITAVMAWLLNASRETRLPIFWALLVWSALLSFFVDNHAVGRRAFGASHLFAAPAGKADLRTEFLAWCHLQPGCDKGAPTPIVFVSAEGGASRAGYWAAEVLGALEYHSDMPGRFSDHVFAISSVSGGSVGAVAYLSTLRDNPTLGWSGFRPAVAGASGDDFLSPAVAGLLFPDLAQRFIPLAFLPDRAETLERGFEAGWTRHCGASPGLCADQQLWSKPFMTLWGGRRPWQPILLVNGARQEDGRRIITSNIQIDPNVFPDAIDFHALTGHDIGISTAISNGARFPLVSPGGTLIGPDHSPNHSPGQFHQGHILDGGYFDGGGVATVADLWTEVAKIAAKEGKALRPIFIELSNDSDADDDAVDLRRAGFVPGQLMGSANHNFLPDILGPLDGLYQARGAHGTAAAMSFALQGAPPAPYVLIHLCKMADQGVPMDWALSKKAKTAADKALGNPTRACHNEDKFKAIIKAIKGQGSAPSPSPGKAASGGRANAAVRAA